MQQEKNMGNEKPDQQKVTKEERQQEPSQERHESKKGNKSKTRKNR